MSETDLAIILNFIVENYADGGSVNAQTELVRSEIIDSHGIVELVEFLEKTFSISFPDEFFVPDNFQTAQAISACVERIRAAA